MDSPPFSGSGPVSAIYFNPARSSLYLSINLPVTSCKISTPVFKRLFFGALVNVQSPETM